VTTVGVNVGVYSSSILITSSSVSRYRLIILIHHVAVHLVINYSL